LIIDVNACSDRGSLPGNEDMILMGTELVRDRVCALRFDVDPHADKLLLAVADGLGGGACGELASEMALSRLREMIRDMPADLLPHEVETLLGTWAAESHAAILELIRQDPARSGMGTTVVGLLLCNGRAYRFHAGDSRLYRVRRGELVLLTADHSLRQESGDGQVPANLLTNCLGAAETSRLEFSELNGGVADFDRFLLCTDGLHGGVRDQIIAGALAADRETAVSTLVKLAQSAGSGDNISVVVADVGRAGSPTESGPKP
jgi:protein phosphatase